MNMPVPNSRDIPTMILEPNGMLVIRFPRQVTSDDIRYSHQQLEKILEEYYRTHLPSERPHALVDLRKASLASLLATRSETVEISKTKGGPSKTAVLGDRLKYILVSFGMNAAGMKRPDQNVKVFLSEEDARKWLME